MFKTEDTWARVLTAESQIPETFRKSFQELAVHTTSFPYVIYVPADKTLRKSFTAKILCLWDDCLSIFEQMGGMVSADRFMFNEISYMESGTVLLHSWVAFYGVVEGKHHAAVVEFNSVSVKLFNKVVERVRKTINNLEDTSLEKLIQEQEKFNILKQSDYKFMNFGKASLLPGETISNYLLQPAIKTKVWFMKKTVCLRHLTIVTDKELILIHDNERSSFRNCTYGGVWRFIPLQKIDRFSIDKGLQSGHLILRVELISGEILSSTFSEGLQRDLGLLLGEKLQGVSNL